MVCTNWQEVAQFKKSPFVSYCDLLCCLLPETSNENALLLFYGWSYEVDKEGKWWDKPKVQNLIQLLKYDSRYFALLSLMPAISHWCCWWVTCTENHFLLEVNYPDSLCFSWYWSNACHSFQLLFSLCNMLQT